MNNKNKFCKVKKNFLVCFIKIILYLICDGIWVGFNERVYFYCCCWLLNLKFNCFSCDWFEILFFDDVIVRSSIWNGICSVFVFIEEYF